MKKTDEKYGQYEYKDEDITSYPIAWTNPDNGKIYIGINSPEYSHLNNKGESELNLAKIISIPVIFQVASLLAALTHPGHIVYLCSRGFAPLPSRCILKSIRYTIIHESLHASSHQHKGLQSQTDTGADNLNYDEYVTDYFAREVYKQILPDKDYVANCFTKGLGGENKIWGGNIVEFMIQSKHASLEEIR
ncbi:hypothetical protein [Photorhabdus bodei]|uniref:hypothetical protein n=1 Tax=Photorhabdus bodei TaxID=2029681 RepID=UPI0032B71917